MDYHKHLVSPLLIGELDDEFASQAEACLLKLSASMVDATPADSAHSLHVVAITGADRKPHYLAGHWLLERSTKQPTNRFSRHLQEGLP